MHDELAERRACEGGIAASTSGYMGQPEAGGNTEVEPNRQRASTRGQEPARIWCC